MSESTSTGNNGRLSRRKPLKTTRILAEIDDETSGTESYYISNVASGLPDTLMSDNESRNIEHKLTSESPLLTEGVSSNKTVDVNIPTVTVISSSSSDDVNTFTLSQSCSRRGRPRKSQSNTVNDTSPLLSIDEFNVGPVLEKLLAMMQSMSMLLSALKSDLRHSNMPEVVAKKRNAATTQLWRAFVAYQKSFAEIEQFACSSRTSGQTDKKSLDVHVPPQSHVNQDVAVKTSETDVIELSESDSEDDVACKRPRYDAAETTEPLVPVSVSSTSVELANDQSLAASLSDSCPAPSASNISLDESSDTTVSCVSFDPPSDSSKQSDVNTSEHVLSQSLNSEPLCNVELGDSC